MKATFLVRIDCDVCRARTRHMLTVNLIGEDNKAAEYHLDLQAKCVVCEIQDSLPIANLARVMDISRVNFRTLYREPKLFESKLREFQNENEWIDQFLQAKGWAWLCVCGGEVVAGSADMQDFPNEEEKMTISEQHQGLLPICMVRKNHIVSESIGIGT